MGTAAGAVRLGKLREEGVFFQGLVGHREGQL